MASSTPAAILLVAMFAAAVLLSAPAAALPCEDVMQDLMPCIGYLTSRSESSPVPCCDGERSMEAAMVTTADKQAACNCWKKAVRGITFIPSRDEILSKSCGFTMMFQLTDDDDLDCSMITDGEYIQYSQAVGVI